MSEILDAIRKSVKGQIKPEIYLGKVKSFDANKWLAVVELNNGATVEDVSVRSVINSETTGLFIEPKKGSYVVCSTVDDKMENMRIIMFSEIENVLIMPGKKIQLRGDDFGGLIKIEEIKTQLSKMTARIDLLYNAINAGTPGTGAPDSGAALATSMKAVIAVQPPKEDFNNMENKNVNHA